MKGIKIALIAILSGLIITLAVGMLQIVNGRWNFFSWGGGSWNSWEMGRAELQNTTEYDVTGVSDLVIDCSQSPYDVYFLPGEGEKITVEEYFTKKLEPEQLAEITVSDGVFHLRQKAEWRSHFTIGIAPWGYFKVYLPAKAYAELKEMTVKTASGDISLPEWPGLSPEDLKLRSAAFSSSSGEIDIEVIKADTIRISSSSGDQTLGKAAGKLDITASSGYVTVKEAKGNTQVSTTSGEIRLGEIDGNLRAGSSSGDIEALWVNGNAEVSATSGYIKLGEVLGILDAETSSGDQRIESVARDIRMSTSSGDQYVMNAGGGVDMESSSGLLRVESLSGKARFSTTSGGVDANVAKWGGDVEVSSSSGDVKIGVPADSAINFRAGTTSGSINTPFDDQLSFDRRETNADGAVNGGGFNLNISTTSGDVMIRAH